MQITAPDGTVVAPPRRYAEGSTSVHGVSPESVRVIAAERSAWLDLDGAVSIWPAGDVDAVLTPYGTRAGVAGQLAALADIGRAITAQAEARMAEVVKS